MANQIIEYVDIKDINTKSSRLKKRTKLKTDLSLNLYKIIGINFLLYIICLIFPKIYELLLLDTQTWMNRPWTLLTSFFLHSLSDPGHILFNMFALFIFGSMLQYLLGPKHFVKFYIISGIIVNFISTFFYTGALIGASGAIMAVVGMLMVLQPNITLYLYFLIPVRLWQLGILYFIIDFLQIFVPNNVANFAHIIGLFIGLTYGIYYRKKIISKLKRELSFKL